MSTVITSTMLSAIDARLRKMAFETKATIPSIYEDLYKIVPTDRSYEVFNRVVGVGEATEVPEASIFPQKQIKQDVQKIVNVKKFGFSILVSRELIMDNEFDPIQGDVAKAMKNSMAQTKERRALNIFNNGFTSQTAEDGLSLFNTAHTLIQGGTQSNRASVDSALDLDSLWTGRNTMQTMKGNSGLYDNIYDASVIAVPQGLERRANEILKSEWIPQSMENTANVIGSLAGMIKVRKSPLLTSTTAWFLAANPSDVPEYGPRFLQREPLSITAQFSIGNDSEVGQAQDRDVYAWKCRERYEVDSVTWFGVYGNAGA